MCIRDSLTGEELNPGDVLIGMASTGVHSNGFSLVRKVFEMTRESLDTHYDELGTTLGEALLVPTRIYVKALKSIKEAGVRIHACSHITGGGFYENIPRMLKEGTHAVVEKDSYPVLPIFKLLAKKGHIEEKMMYNTFNIDVYKRQSIPFTSQAFMPNTTKGLLLSSSGSTVSFFPSRTQV